MKQYVEIVAHKTSLGEFYIPADDSNILAYSLSQKLHQETLELFQKKIYRKTVTNCMELKYAFGGKLVEYYKAFIYDIHEIMNKESD